MLGNLYGTFYARLNDICLQLTYTIGHFMNISREIFKDMTALMNNFEQKITENTFDS